MFQATDKKQKKPTQKTYEKAWGKAKGDKIYGQLHPPQKPSPYQKIYDSGMAEHNPSSSSSASKPNSK